MGLGTSTQQQQQQTQQQTQTQPWAPTIPALSGVLGLAQGQMGNTGATPTESGAISGLETNAGSNPYAGGISSLASSMLSGTATPDRSGYATTGYDQAQASLAPIANQSTNPYDNPAFQSAVSTMSGDISNQIKSQYAGAGYSPTSSGDYAQQLGRGISQGIAPTFLQAQDALTNQRMSAANGLSTAGNSTSGLLGGLDQAALGNRVAGVGVAGSAIDAANLPFMQQLSAEAMRRGIPLQNISQLESLIVPMAALGQQSSGTASGTSNTTKNDSPLTQFLQFTTGLGSLFGKK
jgi:hypothetical protein